MKKWPIALQVYSVRDAAANDFEGTMRTIKAMGYDGVELAGFYDMTAAECKAILDKVGLELVSAHVGIDAQENNEMLDAYASTGLKYIAIPWMQEPTNEEELNAAVERIYRAGRRAKERGMQLLYHNHDFEMKTLGDDRILDTYYDRIPAKYLQTQLDVCWVNVGGQDPSAYLRKYAGRAPVLHLKDFIGSKSENMYALIGSDAAKEEKTEAFAYRPVGYGVQDIPSILQAAEEAGTQWLVVEQDSPSLEKTSLECAQMSIDYLKSIIK